MAPDVWCHRVEIGALERKSVPGLLLQRERQWVMTVCSACGKQNREQARFCGYCGKPLQTATSGPVNAEARPEVQEKGQKQTPAKGHAGPPAEARALATRTTSLISSLHGPIQTVMDATSPEHKQDGVTPEVWIRYQMLELFIRFATLDNDLTEDHVPPLAEIWRAIQPDNFPRDGFEGFVALHRKLLLEVLIKLRMDNAELCDAPLQKPVIVQAAEVYDNGHGTNHARELSALIWDLANFVTRVDDKLSDKERNDLIALELVLGLAEKSTPEPVAISSGDAEQREEQQKRKQSATRPSPVVGVILFILISLVSSFFLGWLGILLTAACFVFVAALLHWSKKETIYKSLRQLVAQDSISPESLRVVHEEAGTLGLSSSEVVEAKRRVLHELLRKAAHNDRITDADVARLESLSAKLELPGEITQEFRERCVPLKMLAQVVNGKLPVHEPPSDVILRRGELCHGYFEDVRVLEDMSIRAYRVGGGSVSIKISKSITLRPALYEGTGTPATELRQMGRGRLVITNSRVMFLGDVTRDIPLRDIRGVSLQEKDGFQIQRESKKSGREIFRMNPLAARVAMEMIKHLAKSVQ